MADDVVGLPGHDGGDVGVAARGDEEDAEVLDARGGGESEDAEAGDGLEGVVEEEGAAGLPFVSEPAFGDHEEAGEGVGRGCEELGDADAEAEFVG